MIKSLRPFLMGAVMAAMMLWMMHDMLMSGGGASMAIIGFVLVHLALAAVAITVAVFGARMNPNLRRWLSRLHRPNAAHVAKMVVAAVVTAVGIHLLLHFGGSPWT